MALFVDVQRIAVVGAEAEKGRGKFIDQGSQRRQVLRNRAFADQHLHALGQLFPALGQVCGLVTVTNTAGEIGVQPVAGKQGSMAVDMLPVERGQLLHALGILVQHPGHVHELGQADHLGMVAMGYQVSGGEPGA